MPASSGFIQETLFFGSSPGSIGALPEEAPNCIFVPELCFFPTTLQIDEPFVAKWVFQNIGFTGPVAVAMGFEGNVGVLWAEMVEGSTEVTLETAADTVITDLIPDIPYSQTLQLSFIVGYYDAAEGQIYYNDPEGVWNASVYVEAGGGLTSTTGLV